MAEGAGIEPTRAFSARIGFEDQGDHQIPSTSLVWLDYYHSFHEILFRFSADTQRISILLSFVNFMLA